MFIDYCLYGLSLQYPPSSTTPLFIVLWRCTAVFIYNSHCFFYCTLLCYLFEWQWCLHFISLYKCGVTNSVFTTMMLCSCCIHVLQNVQTVFISLMLCTCDLLCLRVGGPNSPPLTQRGQRAQTCTNKGSIFYATHAVWIFFLAVLSVFYTVGQTTFSDTRNASVCVSVWVLVPPSGLLGNSWHVVKIVKHKQVRISGLKTRAPNVQFKCSDQ